MSKSRKKTTVLISTELYKYAKEESLNLSAILEPALLRHYREHVTHDFMTKYGYYLAARCIAENLKC